MIKILDVQPTAAVPGGNLFIRWAGKELQPFRRPQVCFGGISAHLVTVSRDLIVAQVPAEAAIGEMTLAMDEIVWAVNPKHDTLDSLANYLGKFAQDFLESAGVR